jgi:hypothetical protein
VKLPFDFGLRLVLRLLLPGAILALALLPIVQLLPPLFGFHRLPSDVLLVSMGLVAGLLFLLLDLPIYMLLEGRRFWPRPIRDAGVARETKRLKSLQERRKSASGSARTEIDAQIAEFPLDPATAEPWVQYPTRLGNLLTAIETYPDIKYGAVGVFYWSRLWVSLDKDLREELDNAQAVADGAIYTCFAFAASALTCIADAAAAPTHWLTWLIASIVCVLLSLAFYRAALPRYLQYGDLFAATFDQHRHLLKFDDLVTDLDAHFHDFRVRQRTSRETLWEAWRFLRWHKYRRSSSASNETVKYWTN